MFWNIFYTIEETKPEGKRLNFNTIWDYIYICCDLRTLRHQNVTICGAENISQTKLCMLSENTFILAEEIKFTVNYWRTEHTEKLFSPKRDVTYKYLIYVLQVIHNNIFILILHFIGKKFA